MMNVLDGISDKVTYFIDENLKHTGRANYTGLELIEKIRLIDFKIPIYILTSSADDIEQYHGDIEFVIDKNDWESEDEEANLTKRFLRHINTYRDIKSKQAKRFDELLDKSIFSTLTTEEVDEFRALNIGRGKQLIDEKLVSDESLQELKVASNELNAIYERLSRDENEQ